MPHSCSDEYFQGRAGITQPRGAAGKHSRMTRQRRLILEELRAVKSHPTAEEIYMLVRSRLPRISLGTVYRNLDVLCAGREIVCLESAGAQKRFDGNPAPHMHVRCVVCGRVGDVDGLVASPAVESVHAENFQILSGRVEFDGICAGCREISQR